MIVTLLIPPVSIILGALVLDESLSLIAPYRPSRSCHLAVPDGGCLNV
jgi:hypothetical protein